MKTIAGMFLYVSAISVLYAQSESYLLSQRGTFTMMPIYQSWSIKDGATFSEVSFALSAYYPLARNFSVSIRGAQANTSGDLTKINSLTDTQLSLQYHIESADVLLSCGVNLPSGRKELTSDELATTILLSNEVFNFQVPSYGQGLNVNPGFTWAIPLSEDLVVGCGATYQLKGTFKPLAGPDEYDPGDEILVSGGLDVRLSESAVLTGDVIFTSYGKDKFAGQEVFASGNRWITNVQFRQFFNQNELWLLARFRTKGKNEIAIAGSLQPEASKISPDQFELLGQYRVQVTQRLSAGLLAEGRFYETTAAAVSGVHLFGVGVAPVISLSPTLSVPARVKYQFGSVKDGGSLSGFEIAAGISASF